MNKPFFSIVLPTRNRCKLLPFAIRSVLNQTFGDFELIISDNFSSDDTPQVATSFDDPRIKYYRSNEPLSIGESYKFALSHATGEYLMFLSDDDSYSQILLETVKHVINEYKAEVVAFRFAYYFQNGDFEFNRQIPANTLAIPSFAGKVTEFSSNESKEQVFQKYFLNDAPSNPYFIIAFVSNAVYHNSVFARLQKVKKELFSMTPADMYFVAALFFVIDRYYCLDLPLYLWNNWDENATASPYKKGNELIEHYKKLLNGKELDLTPLKFALPLNCCVNAILQATKDFDLAGIDTVVDWARYYTNVYDHLLYLKNMKIDVSAEIRQFNDVIATEPEDLQKKVRSNIKNLRFVAKQFVRRFPFAVRLAKKNLRRGATDDITFISGDNKGFEDTLSAAGFLSAQILSEVGQRK